MEWVYPAQLAGYTSHTNQFRHSFRPQHASGANRGHLNFGLYQMQFMPMATAVAAMTLFAAQTAAAESLEDGERLFKQRCQSCHSVTPGKASPAGPTLIGVVGRASGSADFKYSAAMKEAGLIWDAATLDQYLTAPAKLVPGTRMSVSVQNPQQRAAIIEYLATLQN